IIVSILAQLSKAPKTVFWIVFLYTGAATGFFLLRSLRYVILPEASAGTVQAPQRKRRIHFLICLSVLQFAFISAYRNAGGIEVFVELSALFVHVHRHRNMGHAEEDKPTSTQTETQL
ncbi:hypothetical protein BGZ93_002626, partial [Podila epicladia]